MHDFAGRRRLDPCRLWRCPTRPTLVTMTPLRSCVVSSAPRVGSSSDGGQGTPEPTLRRDVALDTVGLGGELLSVPNDDLAGGGPGHLAVVSPQRRWALRMSPSVWRAAIRWADRSWASRAIAGDRSGSVSATGSWGGYPSCRGVRPSPGSASHPDLAGASPRGVREHLHFDDHLSRDRDGRLGLWGDGGCSSNTHSSSLARKRDRGVQVVPSRRRRHPNLRQNWLRSLVPRRPTFHHVHEGAVGHHVLRRGAVMLGDLHHR
mmetsp:Transcript_30203/g.90567  ORF Transcript_30203/g.90567 Transcript_30203/m.90567 type:complete len:262 (-) Transcript_30203:766-1551(-)